MKKHNKLLLGLILLLAIFLRFFSLGNNPPSLYWEEAALGYDAYSILKTGKDFHGHSWPLVAFESFGDYKPSMYFYATVPFITLFDLTPLAIRFPSALFGSLTVLLLFYLTKQFFKKPTVPLLSSLFLAISPWHIQLSRTAFEANLGLFFITLGVWLFIKGTQKTKWLIISVIPLSLSMYTYHANRVLVPILGLALGLFYLKKLVKNKTQTAIALLIFTMLTFPLAIRLNTPKVKQRFLETSAFSDLKPINQSSQLILEDGGGLVPRLVHHRFFSYSKVFINHYLDHFKLDYLFFSGDQNPRHSTQSVGGLYMIQFPLLLFGLFWLVSSKKSLFLPIILWLILAPVPSALTKTTPHALRSLSLVIPLSIISAYGLSKLLKQKWLTFFCLLVLLFEFSRYQYIYHLDYPKLHQSQWQYGYQELIESIEIVKTDYQNIYLTRELGRPSIYYWFYTKTNPTLVQATESTVKKDQGEFLEFDNLKFGLPQNNQYSLNSLIIAGPTDQVPFNNPQKIIYNLNHEPVFYLYQN
jgi:4-amino-4-deoxy-L-arabinose transferase-like glycosyltransferase